MASPMAEHLYIVRWLATAQKQKHFPKTVAIDIQLLLNKVRKQGNWAKLRSHLDLVYSKKFRLIETLQKQSPYPQNMYLRVQKNLDAPFSNSLD